MFYEWHDRPRPAQNAVIGLPPRQRELLFYQAIDRAQAKFYSFKVPTFKRINFLWIDSLCEWPAESRSGTNLQTRKAQTYQP